MSKIQEIKAQIRDGNIDQAMAIAMSEALKIEIVTSSSPHQQPNQDIHFRSTVNLLENEIENELGGSFENQDNNEKIQKIHFQEVENAHQRILQNIQSLQNMFTLLQENS
ncbi:MAG: hypothetical protein ACXITR_10680 [Cyanobacterium sp.]